MSVRIQLDKIPHAYFTNLDFIAGRIVLRIQAEETISAIVVKLEGESRTRLAAPQGAQRESRAYTELEVHKLLYKIVTVFPSLEVQQQTPRNASYVLPPGEHIYPFRFKIPFNNDCSASNSMFTNLNLSGRRMEMARDTTKHVKKTLPPSLSGFPGEAEIRYFVKATVQRPAFYKENFRATADFKFFPIENPRDPPNRRESYARRQHQFSPHVQTPSKPGVFRKQSTASIITSSEPPKISVDGRLPDPAIVTCNEPLPLRVLVKKLNETSETIFLQLFQLELIGYTKIRAHELQRTESNSWIITSLTNLRIPLGNAETPSGKDIEIDNKLWNHIPLPNTVAPSFDTCNLSRVYELEIRVGLSYGASGSIKPELTVQPLRMPVSVFSGIAPPPALLAAMAGRQRPQVQSKPLIRPNVSPPPFTPSPSPNTFSAPLSPDPPIGNFGPPAANDIPDEAPPSYEDAMAEHMAPVDGPRRDYQQPESTGAIGDEKRNSGFGSNERLFP